MLPDNDMSLQRIHALIDGMSKEEDESLKRISKPKKDSSELPEDQPADDVVIDPDVSNTVKDALVTTGKLWTRATGADAAWTVHNSKHSSLRDNVVKALTQKPETRKSKKAKKKQRKL